MNESAILIITCSKPPQERLISKTRFIWHDSHIKSVPAIIDLSQVWEGEYRHSTTWKWATCTGGNQQLIKDFNLVYMVDLFSNIDYMFMAIYVQTITTLL